jgi:hypothetical protein
MNDLMQQMPNIGPQIRVEMGGMTQKSASIIMDSVSVPIDSPNITARDLLDPFGLFDYQLVSRK